MVDRGILYANNGDTSLFGYTLQIKDDRNNMTLLPPDFVPGRWDVICQRGKECFEHAGNKRFRVCIEKQLEIYMNATTRQKKAKIVSDIIDTVQKDPSHPCAGFVKKDLLSRRWYHISKKETRDKVGQALRDAIKIVRASLSTKEKNKPVISTCSEAPKYESTNKFEVKETMFGNGMSEKPAPVPSTTINFSADVQDKLPIEGENDFLASQALQKITTRPSLGATRQPCMHRSNTVIQESLLESLIEPLDYKSDRRDNCINKDGGKRSRFHDFDNYSSLLTSNPTDRFDTSGASEQQSFKRRRLSNFTSCQFLPEDDATNSPLESFLPQHRRFSFLMDSVFDREQSEVPSALSSVFPSERSKSHECRENTPNSSFVFFDARKSEINSTKQKPDNLHQSRSTAPSFPLSSEYSDNYVASSHTAQFLLDLEPVPMNSLQFPECKIDHARSA